MKHILIIDDVATNLRLVSEVLGEQYKVSAAKSGAQGLKVLQSESPDLILLDIGMPGMNGYEVMEQLKANPKTANIPVIFLTADTDRETEAKSLQMGAMDFIRKPFEPQILLGRVEKVLNMETAQKSADSGGEGVRAEGSGICKMLLFRMEPKAKNEDLLATSMGSLEMAVRMGLSGGDLMAEIDEATLMVIKHASTFQELEAFAGKVLELFGTVSGEKVLLCYEVKNLIVG